MRVAESRQNNILYLNTVLKSHKIVEQEIFMYFLNKSSKFHPRTPGLSLESHFLSNTSCNN